MAKIPNSGFQSETVEKHKDQDDKTLLDLRKTESEVINEHTGVMKRRVGYERKQISGGRFAYGGMNASMVRCGCCARGRPEGWFHHAEAACSGVTLEADSVRCDNCGDFACPSHARKSADGTCLCRDCGERWDLARVARLLASALKVVFFREVER